MLDERGETGRAGDMAGQRSQIPSGNKKATAPATAISPAEPVTSATICGV